MNRSHNIFSNFYTKTHDTGTKTVLSSREQHLLTKQMTHRALIFVSSDSVTNRLNKLRAVSTCHNVPLSCQHYSEPLNIVAQYLEILLYSFTRVGGFRRSDWDQYVFSASTQQTEHFRWHFVL